MREYSKGSRTDTPRRLPTHPAHIQFIDNLEGEPRCAKRAQSWGRAARRPTNHGNHEKRPRNEDLGPCEPLRVLDAQNSTILGILDVFLMYSRCSKFYYSWYSRCILDVFSSVFLGGFVFHPGSKNTLYSLAYSVYSCCILGCGENTCIVVYSCCILDVFIPRQKNTSCYGVFWLYSRCILDVFFRSNNTPRIHLRIHEEYME